jgi:uncharacterized protein YkwD
MKRMTFVLSVVLGTTLSAGCGGEVAEVPEGEGSGQNAEPDSPLPDKLAGPCEDASLWNKAFEDEVLTLVNQKRAAGATCGGVAKPKVAAVTADERLRCAARLHSRDMGSNNFMSHTGSNGSDPWQRMVNAGYNWSSAAENVAAGYATPASVVDGWMKSSGHCNNIMGSGLKHLGVGYFYAASSDYKHYWTQDFGSPR